MYFFKRFRNIFRGVCGVLLFFALFFSSASAQHLTSETQLGTPTHSYYLAQSIIQAYQNTYHISGTFQKKSISHNLRARNVYERALGVMEEFDTLFPGVISQEQKAAAHAVSTEDAGPTEISRILTFILNELQKQDGFQEYVGERTVKTPNDVYQIMRKIGWCHRQIAEKLHIDTTWDNVERVYEAVVLELLPTVYHVAENMDIEYTQYAFPRQPRTNVLPRNIYKLVIALYNNVAEYYRLREGNVDMLTFVEVNDCDEITPADVYDLEEVVAAEFKLKNPSLQAKSQLVNRFENWKFTQTRLISGHTFRLLQHLYILTENVHRRLQNIQ